MDILMTRSTEGHRLSFKSYHPLNPFRLFPSWVFVEMFHGSYMVGSGAVVPCGDRPSPALRTVRAACHRTRLALYALLE